jgi:hypothetical protein
MIEVRLQERTIESKVEYLLEKVAIMTALLHGLEAEFRDLKRLLKRSENDTSD